VVVNVLDLFSGIGGFSLGLERAGMRTVAFCEIDRACRRVLRARWPKVKAYKDVRHLSGDRLRNDGIGGIDVIAGGFPCQDISNIGQRTGLKGDMSGLWREFARLIGEIRPRVVVVENVAALVDFGLGDILRDMAALGYDAEWHCIPASVAGAPHVRDRLWIIAHPTKQPWFHEPYGKEIAQRLFADASHWESHPWDSSSAILCRMDDGIPDRVDRTSALGNAVVPQIPEIIGRAIMQAEGLA
jgi:DNA (cytosine-5)-methyltransferase 1